jgi:hypothetical protein
MLLRRITEHVKAQNWFAVAIDFLIVVVGVFIGLQVDTWNDDRAARVTSKTYYARLSADLAAERETRLMRIEYYEKTKRHAVAALEALDNSDQPLGVDFLIDAYQATQRWNYEPHRTTYDELLSVGITSAIPDVELRTQLAILHVNLQTSAITQEEPKPFRDELRRNMPYQIQDAIRTQCGDVYELGENGLMLLSLPEYCALEIEPDQIALGIAALQSYTDLEMDLAQHVSILDSMLMSLRVYMEPIRKIGDQLDANQ